MRINLFLPVLASSASALGIQRQRNSADPGYNCVPGMSCWPTNFQWQAFNQSINGSLYATVPWARPCFGVLDGNPGGFDFEQCSYIWVAGYNFYYPTSIETYQILPEGKDGLSKLQNLTASYKATPQSHPGLTILQNEYPTFAHQPDFANYTTPIGVRNIPRGYAEVLAGCLIPATQLQGAQNQETLVEKFLQGMQTSQNLLDIAKPIATQIYATGPANQPDNSNTGVNPAWRGSLWEVVYAGGWVEGVPQAVQDEIENAVHTADYLEDAWENAFSGSNYDRLLSIKQQYDPSNFFNCWRCVGWNGADDPQYSCYAQSQNPLVFTNPR